MTVNRRYQPFLKRSPDGQIAFTAPHWVEWVDERSFWDDGSREVRKTSAKILRDFVAGRSIDDHWRRHEARRWAQQNRPRVIGGRR